MHDPKGRFGFRKQPSSVRADRGRLRSLKLKHLQRVLAVAAGIGESIAAHATAASFPPSYRVQRFRLRVATLINARLMAGTTSWAGDGGGIVIPPARWLPEAPMPQRTRTGFHASGPARKQTRGVVIRRHADRVSKWATARRPMKPLAFRSNALAGHWWEPTKNSNPINQMHPGRRRCFYLVVLKSGVRSASPRSVGQAVSSGKTGERRRADAKFVPGFQTEADFWNSVPAHCARAKRSPPILRVLSGQFIRF